MKLTDDQLDLHGLEFIADSIQMVYEWTKRGRRVLDDPMMGEAVESRTRKILDRAGELSDALRARENQIDWKALDGLRNEITHEYDPRDDDALWKCVVEVLPRLEVDVERLWADVKARIQESEQGRSR